MANCIMKNVEIVKNERKEFLLKKITVTSYYVYLFVIIYKLLQLRNSRAFNFRNVAKENRED